MVYNNITKLCKSKNISIAALEKSVGLGNATIRGWAESDPSASKLKRVADFFGVTVDELLKED